MFGFSFLDIAIGVAFVFLLSLMASTLKRNHTFLFEYARKGAPVRLEDSSG